MKIKLTESQIANILNESSEDYIVKAIKLLGGIHADNVASVDIIKNIISTDSGAKTRLRLGQSYDFNQSKNLKDKIRFHEYWNRFSQTTDGRGFSFEGLFAGLFGGETTAKLNYEDPTNNIKNPKQDVIIKGNHYSLKIVKDEKERFRLGSYTSRFNDYKKTTNNESLTDVRTFLMSDDYNKEDKIEFLETCFDADMTFIFARLDTEGRSIVYSMCPLYGENGIIDRLVNRGELTSGGGGGNTIGIRPEGMEEFTLMFPYVTREEVESYLPNEDLDRPMDKVYSLFSDDMKRYLRPEVLNYLYQNKEEFATKLYSLSESVEVLKNKLSDVGISDIELIGRFNDEDITDDFLRNLDRKMLKSGDTKENIIKYLEKYLDSLKKRLEPQVEPDDSYFVDDDEEQEKSKIGRKQFVKELRPLQVELLKLQEYVKKSGKSVVIVFEGRDSAGKGSTIKKFTEYLQPRYTKVVALGIPTPEEKKDWFGRYEREISPGKIVFFDRSWYNRGIVEPVMGYSTMEEYADFMENVGKFEQSLLDKGHLVFKFWLSITQDTQRRRFDMRKNSPLKYWKFSPNDEASIDKWDDYTEFKEKALKQTSEVVPWTVVDSNDKRAGALNAIRAVLTKVDYTDKSEDNIGMIYPEVVTTVHEEDLTEQDNSFMRRRVDKIIFRKIVNPRVTIIVEKYPNGQIVNVINPFGIRFPYQEGQLLDMGHKTWAHINGYEVSVDGHNFKGGTEKKKFGIPVSMLPQHLKNL